MQKGLNIAMRAGQKRKVEVNIQVMIRLQIILFLLPHQKEFLLLILIWISGEVAIIQGRCPCLNNCQECLLWCLLWEVLCTLKWEECHQWAECHLWEEWWMAMVTWLLKCNTKISCYLSNTVSNKHCSHSFSSRILISIINLHKRNRILLRFQS